MEKITELKGVADFYFNDENQSIIIKIKERKDYPYFKVLSGDRFNLGCMIQSLGHLLNKNGIKELRETKEI